MRTVINIKNNKVYLEDKVLGDLKDFIIIFDKTCDMVRSDYLFQQYLDYNNHPNWFSIFRKLNKLKKIIWNTQKMN